MDTVTARRIDAGEGTPEAEWMGWLQRQPLPRLQPAQLVARGARAVVVAPHPDDEVLAVGGLLAELAGLGRSVVLIAVTDGEASHPGSRLWPRRRLAHQREQETARALAALGVHALVMRLGLPDGGITACLGRLTARLRSLLMPGDVVFTTWRLDGHPDHEATALAARQAADMAGARLFEAPVWGWHWARAGDARMPWASARMVVLQPQAVQRKRQAVRAFATQLAPDPSVPAPPVLRATTVARAARPFELVFA